MIDPDIVDAIAELSERIASGELSGKTVRFDAPLGGMEVNVGQPGSAKEAWDRVNWDHPDWTGRKGVPVCIMNVDGEYETVGWFGGDGFVPKAQAMT